jgi:UDP-N-acetylmuramyl pentapeptide phosphotransferase/UDP-N-acetylglucosamine-1-phosphate transferase
MDQLVRIVTGFALAIAASVILCRMVMSAGILDAPTEARKTQPSPVPTAGGIAVALSFALALVVDDELMGGVLDMSLLILGAGALVALMIGVVDDIIGLRPLLKLAGLLAVAAAVAAFGARPELMAPWPGLSAPMPIWLGFAGSALWLLVVMNAVNFMDGANGLAMGMAAICATGCCIIGALIGRWDIAIAAGALAGGLCGFLVWNLSGQLFAGDAGALGVGALLAGLSLEIVRSRPDLLFVPAILLLPFLSDVLLTLLWRMRSAKSLLEPHRDHTYQIALKAGLRHWQVSAVHAVWALNAVILAVLAALLGGYAPPLLFLALLAVSSWLHLKVRRAGVAQGLVGRDIP